MDIKTIRRKAVTRNDVAKLAGVSGGTVSYVFNNVPNQVSDKTRKRVLEAAEKLGYTPNNFARALISGKSNDIGIAFYNTEYITHPFFAKTISGVCGVSNENKYGIKFLSTQNKDGNSNNNFYFMDAVNSKQVDGIIIQDEYVPEKYLAELSRINFPFVLINRLTHLHNVLSVCTNHRTIMKDSIDHLLSLKHENIGLIVPQGVKNFTDGLNLITAFMSAIREHKIDGIEGHVYDFNITAKSSKMDRIKALKSIFQANKHITSFICYSDGIAVHVYEACSDMGMQIPKDLSVIGINNDNCCEFLNPQLTSNEILSEEIGKRAAERLFEMIKKDFVINNDTRECNVAYIGTKLKIRNSCDKPRKTVQL